MWASSEPLLQGKFIEAVSLLERSTAIRESAFGPAHPEVGASLNSLAVVLAGQAGYKRADELQRKAVGIFENILSADHPFVATMHINHAVLLDAQGKYAEADVLLPR
ncbi:unnamed protein product, partial [Ectocarpus fasciculatus]